MPKVSVIIPAYNAMKYLPKTLSSVFKQTFNDFEIIIINDGSTDEIIDWFHQINDSRAKLISQENTGLAGARNTGIFHSQGEYLAFLDADDLWEATKLEKQVSVLDNHPEVGLVYTWVAYINQESKSTGRIFKHQIEGDVWKHLTQHNLVECGSVAMVRRCCFDNCGLFDINLGSYVEDWDMWLRIAYRYPFKVVKEPLVFYRQSSSSTSKNWEAMAKSFHMVIEKAFINAPVEFQYLKDYSYGFAKFCLAWKALQSCNQDYRMAIQFRQQGINHNPKLIFSKEYLRLSIAIAIIRYFGGDRYKRLLTIFHLLRRHIVTVGS